MGVPVARERRLAGQLVHGVVQRDAAARDQHRVGAQRGAHVLEAAERPDAVRIEPYRRGAVADRAVEPNGRGIAASVEVGGVARSEPDSRAPATMSPARGGGPAAHAASPCTGVGRPPSTLRRRRSRRGRSNTPQLPAWSRRWPEVVRADRVPASHTRGATHSSRPWPPQPTASTSSISHAVWCRNENSAARARCGDGRNALRRPRRTPGSRLTEKPMPSVKKRRDAAGSIEVITTPAGVASAARPPANARRSEASPGALVATCGGWATRLDHQPNACRRLDGATNARRARPRPQRRAPPRRPSRPRRPRRRRDRARAAPRRDCSPPSPVAKRRARS